MEREQLIAMGLDKKQVDAIMKLHGLGINPLNTQIATLTADNARLTTDLEVAQGEVTSITNTYNNDQESYKAKYETAEAARIQATKDHANEVAAHTATKTAHEAEKTNAAIDTAYTELLASSGLRPDLIPNELKLANRESLALDDKGKLKDPDKVLADAKTRWPKDFAEEREGGVSTFSAGGSAFMQSPPAASTQKEGANSAINAMLRAGRTGADE